MISQYASEGLYQTIKSLMPCAEYIFMMCHKRGLPPISTMGFGFKSVSSLIRVPRPPANITAFIDYSFLINLMSQTRQSKSIHFSNPVQQEVSAHYVSFHQNHRHKLQHRVNFHTDPNIHMLSVADR